MNKRTSVNNETHEPETATPFLLFGFIGLLGPFLVPIYQILLWLWDGKWTPLTTKELFIDANILPSSALVWLADENASWKGIQKIALYITCDMSLFLFLFLLGICLFFLMLHIEDVFH